MDKTNKISSPIAHTVGYGFWRGELKVKYLRIVIEFCKSILEW